MKPLRPRVEALERLVNPAAGELVAIQLGEEVFLLSKDDLAEIVAEASGKSRGLPSLAERDFMRY